MTDEVHQFILSDEELSYLQALLSDNPQQAGLLKDKERASLGRFTVRLRRAEAEHLRSLLTERLARAGFASDYSLTEEGSKLEELIDRFFLP